MSLSRQQDLPEGVAEGRVTRSDGKTPVPGALVRVLRIDEAVAPEDFPAREIAHVYADEEGNYSIAVPEGTYDLRASNFDYIAQAVLSVQISPEKRARVDFRLEPSAVVFGKVTDAAGAPLAGVHMQALVGGRPVAGVRSDEKGEYNLRVNLPSGPAELRARQRGFAQNSRQVNLEVGRPLKSDLALEPPGSLEISLKSELGRPVAGEIALLQQGKEVARRTTNPRGRRIFSCLDPGKYEITAHSTGRSAGKARVVTVRAGERSAATIVLGGNCELRGKVRIAAPSSDAIDGTSPPAKGVYGKVSGAQVVLCEGIRVVAQESVGRDGSFCFAGLFPGVYDVVVEDPAYGVSVRPDIQVGPEPQEVEVNINPETSPSRWARTGVAQELREVWRYRDLVRHLVGQQLRMRYKESVLGLFWSMLTPLMQIVIYTVVFKFILKSGVPNYSIVLFCALLPWNFFSQTVGDSCFSLLSQRTIVAKVRFPRLALPLSTVLANTVHFFLMLAVFLVVTSPILKPFITQNSTLALSALPLLIILQIIHLVGLSALLSWLNALYQDVAYVVGIVLQFGFFLTPIIWQPEGLFGRLGTAASPFERIALRTIEITLPLNPLASLVTSYRRIFMGSQECRLLPLPHDLLVIAAHAAIALLVGYFTFRHVQWKLVEEI